jgi:two-component system CheB/CheR fusion protein
MAREGLQQDLSKGLHKAASKAGIVNCPGLQVRTNGHFTRVDLSVCPLPTGPAGPRSRLCTWSSSRSRRRRARSAGVAAVGAARQPPRPPAKRTATRASRRSKQELRAKDEYLQSTQEELETSNEELKSSNEEMQSVNEELQSTNEELETSKEELQSVNEELATVNTELQAKVDAICRGQQRHEQPACRHRHRHRVSWTINCASCASPRRQSIINLIPSDIGRPVAHIVSNLVGYDRLVADTQGASEHADPQAGGRADRRRQVVH